MWSVLCGKQQSISPHFFTLLYVFELFYIDVDFEISFNVLPLLFIASLFLLFCFLIRICDINICCVLTVHYCTLPYREYLEKVIFSSSIL